MCNCKHTIKTGDDVLVWATNARTEKIAEIIKWLYINDRAFDSKEEWKEAFIALLEETL